MKPAVAVVGAMASLVAALPAHASNPGGQRAPAEPPEIAAAAEASPFAAVARVGYLLAGKATLDADCRVSSALGDCRLEERDTDDTSVLLVEADALYSPAPGFRLGLGVMWAPLAAVDDTKDARDTLGHEVSFVGILEGLVPVSERVTFTARGHGGIATLFVGGDLGEAIDDLNVACGPLRGAGGSCEASEGGGVGFTFGLGAGFTFDTGPLGIRADLLAQSVSYRLAETREALGTAQRNAAIDLVSGRLWLLVGAEL